MKDLYPMCSIIVLNYFGERVIEQTIGSLLNLRYPKTKFEIIIVDNNSLDKSKEIIKKYSEIEKNIRYLFLDQNKGFAGGNNEGIKIAKGEYIILLNNDCIVESSWLNELVKTAQKDYKIFAVSSKIKLYPKYYYLKFSYFSGLFLTNAYLNDSFLSQLERPKKINLNITNKDSEHLLEIPFAPGDKKISLDMNFEIDKYDLAKTSKDLIQVQNREGLVGDLIKNIKGHNLSIKIKLNVEKFKKKDIYERIQNAGIIVFQDGSGRDIGAKVIIQRQFYEYDYGQYSNEQEVYAACGAAVLYNKKILEKIGYLDKSFFMYYEDVEISERARLRGYKIYYSPKAEVRHLHAFSSREWSNFFIYQAEKGRLLHTFFNFPLHVFFKEYFVLILRILDVGLKIAKNLSDRQKVSKFIKTMISYAIRSPENENSKQTDFGKAIQYLKIILFFFFNFPVLMIKRLIKHRYILKNAVNNNFRDILKGRWYFD